MSSIPGNSNRPSESENTAHLASLPPWARHLMMTEVRNARPIRGRILRLKLGYNPNSSSVGSGVYVLPVLLLGISTLFGAVAGLIASAIAAGGRRKNVVVESRAAKDDPS